MLLPMHMGFPKIVVKKKTIIEMALQAYPDCTNKLIIVITLTKIT